MLRNVIVIYIIALLLVVPGLTGLLSAALVAYVLGGMFMLILNMERPYSPDEDSLMDADLEPLFSLNRQIEAGMNMAERRQEDEKSTGSVRGEEGYQPAN